MIVNESFSSQARHICWTMSDDKKSEFEEKVDQQ